MPKSLTILFKLYTWLAVALFTIALFQSGCSYSSPASVANRPIMLLGISLAVESALLLAISLSYCGSVFRLLLCCHISLAQVFRYLSFSCQMYAYVTCIFMPTSIHAWIKSVWA